MPTATAPAAPAISQAELLHLIRKALDANREVGYLAAEYDAMQDGDDDALRLAEVKGEAAEAAVNAAEAAVWSALTGLTTR